MFETSTPSPKDSQVDGTSPPGALAHRPRKPTREEIDAASVGTPETAAANPFRLLTESLQQLADLLTGVSDEQFVSKPVAAVPSSLGGHVRHCLDHYEALCIGAETGVIDYDTRKRGTNVETSRSFALDAIGRLQRRLSPLGASMLSSTVLVRSMLDSTGASIETRSSLGRELAFVLSHTVHHGALLAVMCRSLGIDTPEGFGYAPATVAHFNRTGCGSSLSAP